MSKELQALKFIFGEALFSEFKNETHTKVRECYSIVYEALKELEQLRERDKFNAIGKSIQYCKNEVIK